MQQKKQLEDGQAGIMASQSAINIDKQKSRRTTIKDLVVNVDTPGSRQLVTEQTVGQKEPART